MTIREAVPGDLDPIRTMAHAFAESTVYAAQLHPPYVAIDDLVASLLSTAAARGTIFVAQDRSGLLSGFVGVMVYPHPITGALTGSEIAWWMNPEARGGLAGRRLLERAEAWCQAHGATTMQSISWHERLDPLYARMGYRPFERVFVKELGATS